MATTTTTSGSLTQDASSVELMEELGPEFTAQQVANFRTAFEVFDVNKDGRISTEEIFEVLATMGNEVSDERKRKIKSAVQSVDLEGNGLLDFREFVQFMKIMDEINKIEAQNRTEEALPERAGRSDDTATFKYFSCVLINIAYARRNWFAFVLVYLIVLYNLAYAVTVSVLVVIDRDFWYLNPQSDKENSLYIYVRYIRFANLANFLHCIFLEVYTMFDALQYNGYSRTFPNFVKYVLRPIFVLTLASNVVLIIGDKGLEPNAESIREHWRHIVLPFAQVASAYLTMSYFFYFDTFVEPASAWDKFKVGFLDLVLFNWMRLIVHVFKNVVVFLLLPFNIVFFILNCFAQCFCKGLFNHKDVQSKTSRFLRLVAYHSG